MIPLRQTVFRNLTRTNIVKLRRSGQFLSRFQSTAADTLKATTSTSSPIVKNDKNVSEKAPEGSTKNGNHSKKAPHRNVKLRDISNQIQDLVKSSKSDLTEAIEILEEGLSYLREIQLAENISDNSIYFRFQPIVTELLFKALDPATSLGNKSVEDVLEIFTKYGVCHKYHYTVVASRYFKSGEDKAVIYQNVLKLWLQFLEFEKSNNATGMASVKAGEIEYRPYYLPNLVYFAYSQTCSLQGVKFSFEDASKLLNQTLPNPVLIRNSLMDLRIFDGYKKEFQSFQKSIHELSAESLDPNGPEVYRKIREAGEKKNQVALNIIQKEIQEAAARNNNPINEDTLIRLMDGYYEADRPDEVFAIFQNLLSHGIEKPSIRAWDVVLRTMGTPSYISKISSAQRGKLIKSIESTIETILNNGTEITAKTLSIIIGSFANLNKFDKVDEYLQRFSIEGEGKLPVIAPTKNNILIGLALNKKISEAEEKLKEFVRAGGYVPSTSVMNTFLGYYAKINNYAAVEGILEFMKKHNIPEEVGTYTSVIDIYFKMHREKGLVADVDKVLDNISASKSIPLNDFTYTALIDGLVKNGANIEAARSIFEKASKKYPASAHLYTAMLRGELDQGSVSSAEKLFDVYIKKIRNDARIWNTMINSLLSKREELALQYYENLKNDAHSSPNHFTYYFLFHHFIKRGNKETVQHLIDDLSQKPLRDFGNELPKMLGKLTGEYKFGPELINILSNQKKQN
ncbi:hypothetical protein PICST_33495 [Scheffersomyces stipitis CBS 6054]|uniref:Mitochondrial 15S rRNA processing factor CCM1 n=1 Tax=Scheffersomyces stipitis (strain ATCC 58785 / CBS 6054 / NBRC 10063 / NRRL Y-11545) TaxID=322104 RepID=A3LZC7_PICST|nr:hypothetical protein PICST_33495 [Scheffersomyces stipitis CBS 6054]ABN68317.2 hypothetical protein PICST_33495 [Scheffersomyces stipitis CBS 6054]